MPTEPVRVAKDLDRAVKDGSVRLIVVTCRNVPKKRNTWGGLPRLISRTINHQPK